MDVQTARIVLISVLMIGATVWIAGLAFYWRLRNEPGTIEKETDLPRVTKAEALKRLLIYLTEQPQLAPHGQLATQILDRSDHHVKFRAHGSEITATFHDRGSGVVVEAVINVEPIKKKNLHWMSLLVLSVIPGVLCLVGYFIWVYVIPHGMRRPQTFQTIQIVHVLWPPFLFGHKYTWHRRAAEAFVDNLLTRIEIA